jgi:anti-sigma B factor antagonist
MSNMEAKQSLVLNVPVLTIYGKIDALTSGDLEAALNRLVDCSSPMAVVDMKGVDYISGSGLRVLVGAQNKARKSQGDLVLVSLQPMVNEVFEITGLKSFFSIYPRLEEVLKGIKP